MSERCKLDRNAFLFKPSDEDVLSMCKTKFFLPTGMEITTANFREVVMRFFGEEFHEFVPVATKLTNVNAPVYVRTTDLPVDW